MICTFYSYKGGVGRSMAMANVADVLARRGLKVLIVDFDLEAPGLEQFFRINHDGVRRNPGLLDLLLDYKNSMSMSGRGAARFRDVARYTVPVYPSLQGGGRLDLLPAGQRQDPEQLARYALNLRTFDWQDFYYNWQGERFFEWLRGSLTPDPYDLILVDSRTGVTEMGGICGYQLADTIIMLCAANHQNVDGTVSMLRDFRSPAVEALRHDRGLDIVVVPARIEQGDPALLEGFFGRFEDAFSTLVPDALQSRGIAFRDLTIPYEPLYAFEEQVASDPRQAGEHDHMNDAFQRLADAVAVLVAPSAYRGGESDPSPPAAAAPTQFDAAKRFADFDVFVASAAGDTTPADMAVFLTERGLRVFSDRHGAAAGDDWRAVLEDSLFHSKVLVLPLGPQGASSYTAGLLDLAGRTTLRGESLPVVPVLLPGATTASLAETGMERFQAVDLREGTTDENLERLHQAVRACIAPAAQVETSTRLPYADREAWGEHDADLFFGRDALVERVVETLREQRLACVAGPSGGGKTSLIQAGVVPRLRGSNSGQPWNILSLTCVKSATTSVSEQLQQLTPEVFDRLRALLDDPDPAQPGAPTLLVLDDMEMALGEWEASDVVTLGSIVTRAIMTDGVHVLLVVRGDALPRLREVETFEGLLSDTTTVRVEDMTAEQLRRAIEGPVERVGAAFEPGLVGRILNEMEEEPEALSLLQGLLQELWLKRRNGWLTHAAYDEAGGIGGVVVARAEAVYSKLDAEERTALSHIMLGLVRASSDGEDGRRRQPISALLPAGASDEDPVIATYQSLTERLVDEHLLIARATESGLPAVEPAHVALVRSWPRLRSWLEDDRRFLRWRERLADAANAWDQASRPGTLLLRGADLAMARDWAEDRQEDLSALQARFVASSVKRRTLRLGAALTTVSLIAVLTSSAAFFAYQQRDRAQEARVAAEQQRNEAELARKNAELLRETTEEARRDAVIHRGRLEREVGTLRVRVDEMARYTGELEARVGELANTAQQRADWERRAREAQATAASLRKSLDSLKADVNQKAPAARSRVFVHYGSKEQRELAVHLAKALQGEGIEVPSLDLENPVKRSQLRYFEDTAQSHEEAKRIVAILRKYGVRDLVPRPIKPKKPVREGTYELWLSSAAGAKAR